jgi:hypothetical protein
MADGKRRAEREREGETSSTFKRKCRSFGCGEEVDFFIKSSMMKMKGWRREVVFVFEKRKHLKTPHHLNSLFTKTHQTPWMMNAEFKFLIEEGMNRIPSESSNTSEEISQSQQPQQRRLKPYISKRSRNTVTKDHDHPSFTNLSSSAFETPLLSNETKHDTQEMKNSNSLQFVDSKLGSVTKQESERNSISIPNVGQESTSTITPCIKCFMTICPVTDILCLVVKEAESKVVERNRSFVCLKATTDSHKKYSLSSTKPNSLIPNRSQVPVFISTRASAGLTPEQIQRSLEEHKRKLMGRKVRICSYFEVICKNDSIISHCRRLRYLQRHHTTVSLQEHKHQKKSKTYHSNK